MIAAHAVRALAIGTLGVLVLLDDIVFWVIPVVAFVEGGGGAVFGAAQSGALRAVVPTQQLPRRRSRRHRPGGGDQRRQPRARRRAVRAVACSSVSRARGAVRVLGLRPVDDAHALSGGARGRSLSAARTARRGVPLPLGSRVPANVRASLRSRELHRSRRHALDRRHRRGPRADERRSRATPLRVRRCSPCRRFPFALRPTTAARPRSTASRALDVDRLRPLPRLAERLRADREHPPDGACDPVDRLDRPRLPARA